LKTRLDKSAHTNYLIRIVKERLFNTAEQSGALYAPAATRQCLLFTYFTPAWRASNPDQFEHFAVRRQTSGFRLNCAPGYA